MRIKLQRVHYMPKELKPGVLYVSEEYGAAAHLCACGCGSKIRTPLSPTEWSLEDKGSGPTLKPSIGNWQQVCQSHYWIHQGEIRWSDKWSPEQISEGRRREEARHNDYYNSLNHQQGGILERLWNWVNRLFK